MSPSLEAASDKSTPSLEGLPVKLVNSTEISTRLSDVGGYEEAKLEVMEVVTFLKNPEQYEKLGARLPRGIFLFGDPGNGKTLLARALAGEGNLPFLASNAAEYIQDDGVEKLRKVFDAARSLSPCILFFDEVDLVAKDRTKCDPNQRVLLDELMLQLDGFLHHGEKPVIVLGSSNQNSCAIDAALLRPGRFDRIISMDSPHTNAREQIFAIHMKPLKLDPNRRNFAKTLAVLTPGFSGAKIQAACNEAAIIAARNDDCHVTMEHFKQAIDRVAEGLRKANALQHSEREIAAFHDAGHAVYSWMVEGVDPITKLSIMPKVSEEVGCSQYGICLRGQVLTGENLMVIMGLVFAGRAAEEICLGRRSNLCEKDIATGSKLAYHMVRECGMNTCLDLISGEGIMPYDDWMRMSQSMFAPPVNDEIMTEVRNLNQRAYERACRFIEENKTLIVKVADALMEQNMLVFEDLEEILGKRLFPNLQRLKIVDNEQESWRSDDSD